MAANYLHGVETQRVDRSPRAVNIVKSAVIGLICTAPMGPVNTPTLLLNDKDGAAFCPDLAGFSCADALDAIYDQGAATVVVVNVLDPAIHNTTIAAENSLVNASGQFKTVFPAVSGLVVTASGGTPTYVAGTDYTVDVLTGRCQRTAASAIPANASLKLAYTYADPSKITAAEINGTIDAQGRRLGLKALADCYQLFGFVPKILIAPGYSTLATVATELIAEADKLGAKTLIDAPLGLTVPQAISSRGPVENSNFNTSNDAAMLCYPHVKVYDSVTDTVVLQPLSARAAGVMAAKDVEKGYWWSPSNTEINGIVGLERNLTAKIDDPQSEVNALNEVGIVTVFNSFGTGYRLWGNRNANFPSESGLSTFISVTRTQDIIDESIRYFTLQYIDRLQNQALVDAVVNSINQLMNKLIGDGALLGGKCWYDVARNPETEFANGHLTFNYKLMPPPPFERGTFESELTSEYAASVK
ncbi:phage tail sheath subtilisin-like domain-containing protein [uncultured Deefgea sp.]|uniref:phage tail sheath subtilisin-like domain-containing protein n=1 Tax=uncultured Deefgea sp. TaxID=1304914 RepID=UPI0026069B56|nr:phage tail sheath subtilisin-like domain-containing protein [uncultured Deefgea sp.]